MRAGYLDALIAGLRRGRLAFRRWRKGRPFWGGLFTTAGGVEIILLPLAPLPVMIHQGIAGVASWIMGALMIAMGLFMWFAPGQRAFAGIATIVFALASFVTSNLGGYLIGMLLGLVGGSLGFAWAPIRSETSSETSSEISTSSETSAETSTVEDADQSAG